jgi:23S rRNA pseudouridine1911/1915/1917 synthase
MPYTTLTVDAESAGLRLDLYLVQRLSAEGLSRTEVQRLIGDQQVTVNERHVKASTRLKVHDVIQLRSLPLRETLVRPQNLPLDIVYEDPHLIVMNKAAGIMVHPAGRTITGTLVNALLHHCPDLGGIGGERRPGIVHRLDKETSGVIVVAKTMSAFQRLARQFKDRQIQKEYVALVWGQLPRSEGLIDRPIGRHRSDRKRMSSRYSQAKSRQAITQWRVEKSFKLGVSSSSALWVSLLRLKPQTGRTHQLRVHLADLGFPIVGDKLYGHRRRHDEGNSAAASLVRTFPRQALHAEKLSFVHPATHKLMAFHAPLPQDMQELVRLLAERNEQ